MALYLVESSFNGNVKDKQGFQEKISKIQQEIVKRSVHLVEVQVSNDFDKAFFIFEGNDGEAVQDSLNASEITVSLIKSVRLIGKDLGDIKEQSDGVNYLVEWNLPENLTMEQYLERKRTNSVHYAEVPEVTFSRTYVCEDMTKCLCFYKAPDEKAVRKAREAVKTPLDTITEILPQE